MDIYSSSRFLINNFDYSRIYLEVLIGFVYCTPLSVVVIKLKQITNEKG